MRALSELLTVFVAAFFGFFALMASLLVNLVGFLFIAAASLFSGVSLLIALFAGVMFAFTGNAHDGTLAVGYSLYSAAAFALVTVALYYRTKLREVLQARQMLGNVQGLRLEPRDASFEPAISRR